MIKNRCKTCLWWDAENFRLKDVKQPGFGYCRKHKPMAYSAEGSYWGAWPLTHETDLCGEWREDT